MTGRRLVLTAGRRGGPAGDLRPPALGGPGAEGPTADPRVSGTAVPAVVPPTPAPGRTLNLATAFVAGADIDHGGWTATEATVGGTEVGEVPPAVLWPFTTQRTDAGRRVLIHSHLGTQ
jgi:hypothetical protein